jgi:lysophospholipase L1-like esterase
LKKIIFFGDSITHAGILPNGYIDLLKKMDVANQYDFIESGVNGNKIYDLYFRLKPDVLEKNPDCAVIFIGVNDVWHKQLFRTGTAYHDFEKFYAIIIEQLNQKNIKTILCSPAVIGEMKKGNEMDFDLYDYTLLIEKLAQKNKLLFVNFRTIFKDFISQNNPNNQPESILTTDGVHLNNQGNRLVAATLWEVLQSI